MSNLKTPPHSIESEQAILGAVLFDHKLMHQIVDVVESSDFYDPAHSLIFSAMIQLYSVNKPIDIITVKEVLDSKKELKSVGWIVYISDLTNFVPSSANIFEYAQIIKNKSVLRKLISCGTQIQGHGFDEVTGIQSILEKSEQALFTVTQTFIKDKLVHIKEILNKRYDEYSQINENPQLIDDLRVKSGFKNLDNKIQGFKPGDMVILAARPSMGKTAFALNFAQNAAKKGKNIAIFSLEMSKEQLADRMVCSAMGIDSWKLQKGELTDEEFGKIGEALDELSRSSIYIDDSSAMNLLEIKSKCRRLKMESGLDLVIIDYLQLIGGNNPMNRVQEISEISRGIKALAREIQAPVVALSQLSRAVEARASKEPVLSDLRESGSIEQDADVVMMMYREDYYMEMDENSPEKGATTILIRKNRNGPVGAISMKFDSKFMKFREIDEMHGDIAGF